MFLRIVAETFGGFDGRVYRIDHSQDVAQRPGASSHGQVADGKQERSHEEVTTIDVRRVLQQRQRSGQDVVVSVQHVFEAVDHVADQFRRLASLGRQRRLPAAQRAAGEFPKTVFRLRDDFGRFLGSHCVDGRTTAAGRALMTWSNYEN